eukprot:6187441-Pleurochrysis_carterae.AAC.3
MVRACSSKDATTLSVDPSAIESVTTLAHASGNEMRTSTVTAMTDILSHARTTTSTKARTTTSANTISGDGWPDSLNAVAPADIKASSRINVMSDNTAMRICSEQATECAVRLFIPPLFPC